MDGYEAWSDSLAFRRPSAGVATLCSMYESKSQRPSFEPVLLEYLRVEWNIIATYLTLESEQKDIASCPHSLRHSFFPKCAFYARLTS